MGLFDRIFGNAPKPRGEYTGTWKMINGYVPHFTTWSGGIYESELIRAAIEARATHIGKLKVETFGAAKPALQNKLKYAPNEFQSWDQFLRRLSAIRDVHNVAFLTPVYDRYGEVSGIYAPLPSRCEIAEYGGKPYLRYEFSSGEKAAIELEACGIMNRYLYSNDFYGESNAALLPTLDLINIQNQGIKEGVQNSARYSFIARLSNFSKASDLAAERKRFSAENFGKDADGGGLLLFPNTYQDVRQIDAKPWIIDDKQMQAIKDGVFEYFQVNEDVLTGSAYGDKFSAFYETVVESFSIQFSEICSHMLFSLRELSAGNKVMATSNRLQYMTNSDKLAVSTGLVDRGMLSINEAREIWNLPPVDGGDVRVIRGEYYNTDEKVDDAGGNAE